MDMTARKVAYLRHGEKPIQTRPERLLRANQTAFLN
jgi:hypothetical protein